MKKEYVLDIVGMTLCGVSVLFEIIDTIIGLVTGYVPTATACTIFLLCTVIVCLIAVHAIDLKTRWSDGKYKESNNDSDK